MRKKIQKIILITLAVMLICLCGLITFRMIMMQKTLVAGNKAAGENIGNISEKAMSEQARNLLNEMSSGGAKSADDEFADFVKEIKYIVGCVEEAYAHPDSYGPAELKKYDASDSGNPATYAAYGDNVDPSSPEIQKELSILANVQGVMLSINENDESMDSNYYASSSGLFIGNEPVSEYILPEGDNPLYFEARQRPWYLAAEEQGRPAFTGIINDIDTGNYAITCGIPVMVDGEFKGVAGAGMYLDTIRDAVDNFKVGENGYACVINDHGQVLFSGASTGKLSSSEAGDKDLRKETDSTELSALITEAVDGVQDIRKVNLDGSSYYIAFSPMETVGWSYLAVLPEEEVLNPTRELLSALDESNAKEGEFVYTSIITSISGMILILLLVGILAMIISARFADRIVAPVVELTESVSDIEGDNLDFKWDKDTGDEVQTLAKSFESMTGRMKQYIRDITEITAEKERIGAELSVATNIQASMLPSIFPPFPERSEFDLYAKMDPAKEVGGDFYDFFFVDHDHLAIVIADVSGKGVPAALFMVIAKTLIKNQVQSGKSVIDAFIDTNNQLCEGNGAEMFVTAWLGIIDLTTGVMDYTDAGHENPYLLHDDGSVEMLTPVKKKMPLAAIEGTKYLPNEITLKNNDCLFLYTDGVPEATSAENELYSTDRLLEVLKQHYNDGPEDLLTNVRANVDEFVADAPQFDDLTMLAIKMHI